MRTQADGHANDNYSQTGDHQVKDQDQPALDA